MNYILHFCKLPVCRVGWLDTDTNNAHKPPTWRYCPECQKNGFVNPERKSVDLVKSERMRKAVHGIGSEPTGANKKHESGIAV